jgi:hypothetical protein
MITDNDLEFIHNGENGIPLVWVIDGQCLYDLPLYPIDADMFMNYDEVIDISDQHPDHDGITIAFYREGELIQEFQTSEYFGSILLSDPLVLNLLDYPGGASVMSPYATFDGEKFVNYEATYG